MSPPPHVLSIVMPCHNEQEVLPSTFDRVLGMADAFADLGLGLEVVMVNDGSRDRTAELLDQKASSDPRVKAVHLTRNFGHQAAVTAGLETATGDAVAVMDADLQDPPEVLPQFIDKWRQGYQVVYAVRTKRKEWFGKRFAYWAFYRLLAALSEIEMPLDSGDFCIMDRSAVDLLNRLPERQRFVRGLRTWVGLKQAGVVYERAAREAGEPSYTFRSLLKLASDGLVSFSSTPLRLITRMGMFFLAFFALVFLYVIVARLFFNQGPAGWAFNACLILLGFSFNLIALGVIGEYLSRIFLEVKGRPTFLVARTVTVDQPAPGSTPDDAETTP
ncbi:MAG: glycosyltransferase family 2 protein [Planctomycetota bacterium]